MIHYTPGNLLDTQCDALVNAEHTVGIMGKGFALQFSLEADVFIFAPLHQHDSIGGQA